MFFILSKDFILWYASEKSAELSLENNGKAYLRKSGKTLFCRALIIQSKPVNVIPFKFLLTILFYERNDSGNPWMASSECFLNFHARNVRKLHYAVYLKKFCWESFLRQKKV